MQRRLEFDLKLCQDLRLERKVFAQSLDGSHSFPISRFSSLIFCLRCHVKSYISKRYLQHWNCPHISLSS